MTPDLASLEARNQNSLVAWRAVGVLVAAFLVVLGARYLINDAIPFLTDISSDKFGRFWPRRVWLSWSISLLATEVILQGRKVMARRSAVEQMK